jgi:peptidoglycan/LPS O-acetylase OafA/YrhL
MLTRVPVPAVRPEPSDERRDHDLDLLRLLAMAIVSLQHGLTVVGHYDWTMLGSSGVSLGQFGVALFCALSGWFALAPSSRAPLSWLAARLVRLYPAYWLATLFAFGLALALQRPVTLGQFPSQMAGTGFFTHGWNLVNVVSWFVSLIILCYGLATLARMSADAGRTMLAFGLLAVLLLASHAEIALSRHVIVFVAAALAGRRRRSVMLMLYAGLLLPLLAFQPSFIYAVVALPVLWLFRQGVVSSAPVATGLANYCYEFFLLHGLFLAAGARLIPSAPLAILVGIAATVPASVLLKLAARRLSSLVVGMVLRPVWRGGSG